MMATRDKAIKVLLLVSSLAGFGLLALAAYEENVGADWYRYQSDYKRQLLARADTEHARLAAERFDVHPDQVYLPELDRIDRCVTCHVAIDNPAMKDASNPLQAHPGDILTNHPKETFGCTICHQGQGRATTEADAHGHVPFWEEPLLPPGKIDRACVKCHTQRSLPGAPRYNAAMALFHDKACLSCHTLRGQGGDKGPDISHAGATHDAEWHFKHFKDPTSVVATSEMPNLYLTDEEAHTLVFLMMSLTDESIPTDLLSNPKSSPVDTTLAQAVDPLAATGYVGSTVCIGCHQGLNPNAVEGWRTSPMANAYDRIKDEPNKENCLPCHATGLNPETGHYSERSVGCEACHGPGAVPVKLVLSGKANEHKKMNHLDRSSTLVCVRCHNPHMPLGTHAEYYRRQPTASTQARRDPSGATPPQPPGGASGGP